MPRIKWTEISLGNIISVMTILASVMTVGIAGIRQIDSVQASVAQKNSEQDLRITALEDGTRKIAVTVAADHDMLVEIRADLKAFRAEFARTQKP